MPGWILAMLSIGGLLIVRDMAKTVFRTRKSRMESERCVSETGQELCDLRIRLSYPWKFWKLVNHYSNNNKVWISCLLYTSRCV